jgi:D-beta-D-heptose 7-phosphate kinase/D-beta-D-heptose 1-phosphate adenosyltransferase
MAPLHASHFTLHDGKRVMTLDKLRKILPRARRGKRVVLTNGVFDLLHVGHVTYLERAKSLGDLLVVAVNGDASVRALKGPSRPVHSAPSRARVLAGLRPVDFVTVFPEVRAAKVIRAVKPDVYVKGGDYTPATLNAEERAALKSVGAKVRILPFVRGYSTTKTLRKMRGK